MPSTVGKQKTETSVLTQAVKLELDCAAAYRQASVTLKDRGLSDQFEAAQADCKRHIALWQARLTALGAKQATRNIVSEPLNRFKIKIAGLFGLAAVHRAIQNNPADCTTAYERVAARTDLRVETRDLARSFLPDAARHAQWVEDLVSNGAVVKAH